MGLCDPEEQLLLPDNHLRVQKPNTKPKNVKHPLAIICGQPQRRLSQKSKSMVASGDSRLSHKSPVIASARRARGDLNCITVSGVRDCHVASLLAMTDRGVNVDKNHTFKTTSLCLTPSSCKCISYSALKLSGRVTRQHKIMNVHPFGDSPTDLLVGPLGLGRTWMASSRAPTPPETRHPPQADAAHRIMS